MSMKPVTKIQKQLTIKQGNNMLKTIKLPATKIRKLYRLSSIKVPKQVNQQVDFEFEKIFMPKIEEAIYFTNRRINGANLQYLNIIEYPQNSKLQKIFLIKNSVTDIEYIRLYVRFENNLIKGNYSFFYYTYEDNFTTHYNLGKVYWSKTIC